MTAILRSFFYALVAILLFPKKVKHYIINAAYGRVGLPCAAFGLMNLESIGIVPTGILIRLIFFPLANFLKHYFLKVRQIPI